MNEHYERYYRQFTPERYDKFAQGLGRLIGSNYRLSTTPLILTKLRFQRLVEITDSVVKLLQSPRYHEKVTESPWFLPQNRMRPSDYFGDVEFHAGAEEEKIIEINFNPPGHVGLLEILEQQFLDAFDLAVAQRVNEGFEEALVEAVTDHYRFRKVAVGVSHLPASQPYYAHYKYFEEMFGRRGVTATVLYARDVQADREGYPVWRGERYERVFNLLIVKTWEDNQDLFEQYRRVYERHPEMFFLNPLGWKLGTKRFLAECHNLARQDYGLPVDDVERIQRASLKTHLLSDFSSAEEVVECFGGERNLVLKPLDGYHVQGVAIRPSMERIKPIFDTQRERYVVQQYFPPGVIPCISADGTITERLSSLRMGFLNGKFFGMRGYNFTYPPTHEELTPVVVV